MKLLKKILKWILYILVIPLVYIVVSLVLTSVTINKKDDTKPLNKTIFLSTNGVHLDVILSQKDINHNLLKGIKHLETENYISFGWGDEDFYLNMPTWDDLTFNIAFRAMFLKSSTLMHVTRFSEKQSDWTVVKLSKIELNKLNDYILKTFEKDKSGNKIMLQGKGYFKNDDFYRAKGNYSMFKTCNTWVNSGFKQSGLKSCYWTPFPFGLIQKYE